MLKLLPQLLFLLRVERRVWVVQVGRGLANIVATSTVLFVALDVVGTVALKVATRLEVVPKGVCLPPCDHTHTHNDDN